jgi:hypothetical protein
MTDIGKVGKMSGFDHSHNVQSFKAKLAGYSTIQSIEKTKDLQATYKAYMNESEKVNPLKKRHLKKLKKPPFGKTLKGFNTFIPLNRVG